MNNFKKLIVSEEKTVFFNETEIKVKNINLIKSLCTDFCSQPQVSPSKNKMAFVSPYIWESVGELYIYDFISEDIKVLIKDRLPNKHTIKKIEWLNNDILILIIGLAYGTVSLGGNLYLYNSLTDELNIIVEKTGNKEIIDFNICGKKINLEVAQFDENYMNHTLKLESIVI